MRSKLTRVFLLGAIAVTIATAVFVRNATATDPTPDLFKGKTLTQGTFADIDVFNQYTPADASQKTPGQPNGVPIGQDVWLSLQKTKGPSDLYIQSNTWKPGGSTGWHTHPGHSLIILTKGTLTAYDGDDPTCAPKVYQVPAGGTLTLVDPGGNHAHLLRNEGSETVEGYAVQLIPQGATRRIDVLEEQLPAACRGIY